MKKVLVILLVFAIAGSAFAQTSIFGRARTEFGGTFNLAPENTNDTWHFDQTARIGVRGGNDIATFNAQINLGDNPLWRANINAKLSDNASLSAGQDELPWVQFSSLMHYGNNNSGFGASNTPVNPYFRFNISGLYLGLTAARNTNIHGRSMDHFPAPGWFLGYEHVNDDRTLFAGGAFAGIINNSGEDDIFSCMGKGHVRFIQDDLTVRINVAFYMAPQFGFFNLPGVTAPAATASEAVKAAAISTGKDAMVLEAMLDVGIRLDACALGITAAFVGNFADDDKGGGGQALRAGFSANFNVGGGYRIIPGALFTHYLKGAGGVDIDNTNLAVGVTFLYAF